ncbi:MAG: sigma-54 dependent transcriptional regulator [Pseudobdellovibrio sp.]
MSNSQLNLLIVEDDQILATSLKLMAPDGFKVFISQKIEFIPDHVFFHAGLVDMHLHVKPGEAADGPLVIQKLIKQNPQMEIVAMSGHLDRALMEKAIKAGAQRFLAKPLLAEEVIAVLEKIEAYWKLRQFSYEKFSAKNNLIGSSSATDSLRKKIAQLKMEKTAILIEGETGTGKEVVAQLINQQEGQRPFVSVNCSAVTDTLFESEFFGHAKGAFTGADSNKIGFCEAAHGGDLFLDEIEALPLNQQAKLLRFLESGEFKKVGGKDSQYSAVRLIAASNIPLKKLIQEKKFREDLYFRLSSNLIEISPLRDRTADIEDLATYFIDKEKPKRNKEFDADAIQALKSYAWPGNVRELKRICEQLVLISPLPSIRETDVRAFLYGSKQESASVQYDTNQSLEIFLKTKEKEFIEHSLQQTKDVEKSSELLKVSKSNLYKKIKELGIQYE